MPQDPAERTALLTLLRPQAVAKRILTLRQLHGWSRAALAEKMRAVSDLRTTRWTVANWERPARGASDGHRPVAKARKALAQVFDVPEETFSEG